MTNLTIMTLQTMLATASLDTLAAWVADVERTCGVDGITATEARHLLAQEQTRRST